MQVLQVFAEVMLPVLPVLLVAAVGGAAGRRLRIPVETLADLVFFVFSPALVFVSIADIELAGGEIVRIVAVVVAVFVANLALAVGWSRLQSDDARTAATGALAASLPNHGNLGLPIAALTLGDAGLRIAVVAFTTGASLQSSAGVAVGSAGQVPLRQALVRPLRYPWDRVQRNLDAQNKAGERTRSHPHYLKGTIYCGRCESRLIVIETKNRHGTLYRYFVCIGRHLKRNTCDQRSMRIEHVEALVEDHYATIGLTPDRSGTLRDYIHDGLSAKRADAELERRQQRTRLAQLDRQRHKLLQAHYDDAIAPDLFKAEPRRITQEMETANTRLAAVDQLYADIETTLDRALRLGENSHQAYLAANPSTRRLMNQAFFHRLYISDDDTSAPTSPNPSPSSSATNSPPRPRPPSPRKHKTRSSPAEPRVLTTPQSLTLRMSRV